MHLSAIVLTNTLGVRACFGIHVTLKWHYDIHHNGVEYDNLHYSIEKNSSEHNETQ